MTRLALCLALLAACGDASPNGIPAGQRLLTAEVTLSGPVPAGRIGLQAVALFVPGTSCAEAGGVDYGEITVAPETAISVCAVYGEPFDPGEQGGGVGGEPLRLLVPCALAFNLVVQAVSVSSADAPGDRLAVVGFASGVGAATSTVVPADASCRDTPLLATNLLDLGALAVPAVPAESPALVVVGGAEGGTNPLSIVDGDGDGTPNLADDDDDDDGVLDAADADDDGDGIDDVVEEIFALLLG